MKPIRVLHVVPAMNCGGMETFIMNIFRNIDRSQVQFDFLYHYADECFYDKEILALGGKIYKLSIRNDHNFQKYFRELDAFFTTHTEYRIIHGHYSGFGMFYNYYAKKHGVCCRIGHSHSDKYEKGLIGQMDRFMSKPFRYGLTHRFACSEAAGKFLFGRYPFQIYLNGIDAERFRFDGKKRQMVREMFSLDEADTVIGHVGRFDPVKNHNFLLDALADIFRKDASFKLILVGDGMLRDETEKQAEMLGIRQQVVFAGIQKNTEAFYSAFDLFVLPSRFEGIPLSLIEAQANGLPCVISDKVNAAADITGRVTILPLEKHLWQKRILHEPDNGRQDAYDKICNAGYDIQSTATYLQNFYLNNNEW